MKLKMWIVLPEHKAFEIWFNSPDKEYKKEEFDEIVKWYRDELFKCENISIAIVNEYGVKETLILWGNVLKNSYIRAQLK